MKKEIVRNLKEFKENEIHIKNAHNILNEIVYEKDTFLSIYFEEVQKFITGYRNFELSWDVYTKENDLSFKFGNAMKISKSNVNSIFMSFDVQQFKMAYTLMKHGFIKYQKTEII